MFARTHDWPRLSLSATTLYHKFTVNIPCELVQNLEIVRGHQVLLTSSELLFLDPLFYHHSIVSINLLPIC